MLIRTFVTGCALLALTCALHAAAIQAAEDGNFVGAVVSAENGKLVIQCEDEKERSFTIDENTKILVDDEPGSIGDLTAGMRVNITADAGGKATTVMSVKDPPSDIP